MSRMIVVIPLADLRAKPSHRSERISQALYGATVTVIEQRDQFVKVIRDDGYVGWMAESYLKQSLTGEQREFLVTSNFATFVVMDDDSHLTLPHGARPVISGDSGLSDFAGGGEMTLDSGVCLPLSEVPLSDPELIARQFHGAPYLWGGISPFGFDCSGFVQTVFRRCGKVLPRDSADQEKIGVEIDWHESRAGDLIFFPGHVAIHLGEKEIIHASRETGMVAVQSLDPNSERFRSDLAENITSIKRVL